MGSSSAPPGPKPDPKPEAAQHPRGPSTPRLRIIGRVRSQYTSLDSTPVQSGLNPSAFAVLDVREEFTSALDGVEGFDYLWLLTWLDAGSRHRGSNLPPLRQVPFLGQSTGRAVGVFATRGPRRVNPLGLSLVRVIAVEGYRIRFAGVDMIDGTAVLDIKPYVSAFDRPAGQPRCGWFDLVDLPESATPESLRG